MQAFRKALLVSLPLRLEVGEAELSNRGSRVSHCAQHHLLILRLVKGSMRARIGQRETRHDR